MHLFLDKLAFFFVRHLMIVLVLKKEDGRREEEENEQEIGKCKSHKLWQKRVSINGRAVSRV